MRLRLPATAVALLASAAGVIACAGPRAGAPATPPPAGHASGGGAAAYFPLAAGNSWTWQDLSPGSPAGAARVRTVTIRERTPDGFWRDSEGNELRAGPDCVQDRLRRLLCAPLEAGKAWTSVVSVSSTERYEIAGVGEAV